MTVCRGARYTYFVLISVHEFQEVLIALLLEEAVRKQFLISTKIWNKLMPWSHLQVNLSHKSHTRRFSQKGVGRRARNSHLDHPLSDKRTSSHSILQNLTYMYVALMGQAFTWRCDQSINRRGFRKLSPSTKIIKIFDFEFYSDLRCP